MSRLPRIWLIGVLLILAPAIQSQCQDWQYKFRHLTTEDGLPINYCWQVMKDSRGFIWISTRAGLCRYDGYEMKVFQYDPLDSTSLSDNRISSQYCMTEDTSGYIWVGTSNGLNRYDPVTESFNRYWHDPEDLHSIGNDWIFCLHTDPSGTLWVGTGSATGLNRYDPGTDNFNIYKSNPDDTTSQLHTILCMHTDQKGRLWLGTSEGAVRFDNTRQQFIPVSCPSSNRNSFDFFNIKNIFEDIDGTLLFGTQKGYFKYIPEKNEIIPYSALYDGGEYVRFIDLQLDPFEPDKTFWAAWKGLYRVDRETLNSVEIGNEPGNPSGIIGNNLKAIYSDESGTFWIPGTMGVNIMNPRKNPIESHPEFGRKYPATLSFLEDHSGDFWIGTDWHLVHYDRMMNFVESVYSGSIYDKKVVLQSGIWSLYEDSDHNLWIGTIFGGVFVLDAKRQNFKKCQLPCAPVVQVYDFFEDSQGILWIATERGTFQRKPGTLPLTWFTRDTAWGAFSINGSLSIHEDKLGNLWIGTVITGLIRQKPEDRGTASFLQYKHDPENDSTISNDWVWCIYEDAFDNLWIATESGLNRYIRETDSFVRYLNQDDLGANFIYDMEGDSQGNLWLTTESGLIRFTPGQHAGQGTFRQILPFEAINPYRIYKNSRGKMFVGSLRNSAEGYFSFYPDELIENKKPPPVVITRFLVHDKELTTDTGILVKKNLLLNHNQSFFTIEFAALDYTNPGLNQYAYKLEGLDKDWIQSGTIRTARYTKVLPGNYIFRVKGSNSDGYWNEEGASLVITILPPPWKTWWAYTGYILIILVFGYLVIRFYLNRLKLVHKLEMEHVEAEKLKELDTLKSRFFANISHEFRTPLTLIIGPLEKIRLKIKDKEGTQDLNIMQRNAIRLQNLINQLLNLSKLESGQMKLRASEVNLVKLVNGYVQSFESLAKQRKIDLVFMSDKAEIHAFVDQEKMEKILFNLLSNAFKFTPAGGGITVSIPPLSPPLEEGGEGEARKVRIIISDTGPGISPEKLPYIFDRFYQTDDSYTKDQEGTGIGLALTKELVELHHGKIIVESEVGKGTTFTVTMPLGKEHFKVEEIIEPDEALNNRTIEQRNSTNEVIQPSPANAGSMLHTNIENPRLSGRQAASSIQHPASDPDQPVLLIVEDNADMRTYIRSYLDKSYHVFEADNGKSGLELAVEQVPDLVISDVMMPGMDGFELCEKIKTDERTSHIPVILLTAKAGSESRIEGLETGADDFITKPFDADELLVRIRNLIEQRRKLQQRFLKNAEKLGLSGLMGLPDSGMNSMDQQFLKKAINTVNDHLADEGFSIEQLEQLMNVSKMQLYRKLKALVNLSPIEFIRSVRLSHAARMIREKSGNIAQIAYAVGFNNPSYFAESFKKQFGVLPSEYS